MIARALPEFCFYRLPACDPPSTQMVPDPTTQGAWTWWTPSHSWRPQGVDRLDALACLALHHGRIFRTREFGALLFAKNGQVIHRSVVYPRWFRYPFMLPTDLQIGNIWTDPAYRNQGIATSATQEIRRRFGCHRALWYLTLSSNTASRRVAEKNGFLLVGTGIRTSFLGLRILGHFAITEAC